MRRVPLNVDVDASGNGIAAADVHGIITGCMRTYNGQGSNVDGVLFEQYVNGAGQPVERTLLTVTNSNTVDIDWAAVRKYVSPEPSVSVGSEAAGYY